MVSTNLLAETANKKTLSSCLRKLEGCFFLINGFRSDCPEKFEANTSIA